MVWVSRDGKETSVARDFWADIESVALDKGGDRIAISMAESDVSAIWIHDMTSGTRSRLTFEGYEVWRPLWHPDDERIAYVSDRGRSDATRSLWIQRADGSDEPVLLVQSDRYAQELTWSADGKAAVYREGFSDGGSMRDLHVLHSPESSEPRPFLTTEADESCPKLSPDGRFLAYISDESGRNEVYVRSFPSGKGLWQVSSEGGNAPLWRRDGKELFYIHRDGVLVAVPVLEEASFAMGPHEELFSTQSYHKDPNSTSFDIDPDGERFLMIKLSDDEMVVVLNWVEEVRRSFEEP